MIEHEIIDASCCRWLHDTNIKLMYFAVIRYTTQINPCMLVTQPYMVVDY